MPLFLPIRARHHHAKRPVDPVDKKLSRSVLVLILSALLTACGVVLLIVSFSPGDDKASLGELIVGVLALILGIVLGAFAIHFYRKYSRMKKQAGSGHTGPGHSMADKQHTNATARNGTEVAVINSGKTSDTVPEQLTASYVDLDDNSSYSDGFERGGRERISNDFVVVDADAEDQIVEHGTDWNASTMKLDAQAMRIRHTPPSPDPRPHEPPPRGITTTEIDGAYAEISDFDYFTEHSHTDLEASDIVSDVVSFKSAQEELSTPPPEHTGVDTVDGSTPRARRSVHFNDHVGENGVENIAYERRLSEELSP